MKAEQITEEINGLIKQLTVADRHIAVGNDLVHLPSFIKSCTPAFIKRVFTPDELTYCSKFADPYLRYASTWAAKEAVYKAVKQADENIKLWWKDIEILRANPAGKPIVQIRKLKVPLEFSLTISHDGDYVWAIAICLYNKK
ncbi:MAG: holo-ACP synthase [Ginsengibacter sp.]